MSQNIAKSIVLVSALAVAGGAVAFLEDATNSAGFGVLNSWMKGENVFRSVVAKSYPQANVFTGMRCGSFGVELGYTFSKGKKKDSKLTKEQGDAFNKTHNVSAAENDEVKTKARVQGFNLDVLGYAPVMDDAFEVFGLVGLGFKKAKVNLDVTNAGANAGLKALLASAEGKNKVTLRVGLGASYMVTDTFGLRGKALYETTSRATITGDTNYNRAFDSKMFKDNYSLGLDLFVKF